MPIDDSQIFDKLQTVIRERFPSFRVGYKDESFIQRVVGAILSPFNPGYMSSFATTWGSTVWFPSRKWVAQSPRAAWQLLAHEHVHVFDAESGGVLRYTARWAWPQVIAALALLASLGLRWWPLWGLALALVALRLPSDTRLGYEVRGYAAGFAADWWIGSTTTFAEISAIAGWLSSSQYAWAARSEDVARGRLANALQAVQTGAFLDAPGAEPYRDIAEAIARANAMVRPLRPNGSLRARV